MNVDIYQPRLDVSFKKSHVPKERGDIPHLRKYWLNFSQMLARAHKEAGDNVRIIEAPLWQITPTHVKEYSCNTSRIYIPHKMKMNWHLDERVRYYMQTVLPHIFSIDIDGWCASSSNWPIGLSQDDSQEIFNSLVTRISQNVSKFPQPPVNLEAKLPKNFFLFPCQLPRDETIVFHSDISVEKALTIVLEWMATSAPPEYSLIIKGHPANPKAMLPLKRIYNDFIADKRIQEHSFKFMWIDDISIHQLIGLADSIFTVNSGVGFEYILHLKNVYTFGMADYASVSTKVSYGGSLQNAVKNLHSSFELAQSHDHSFLIDKNKACRFVNSWYNCYDVTNFSTY